jgi:hypothetical protein
MATGFLFGMKLRGEICPHCKRGHLIDNPRERESFCLCGYRKYWEQPEDWKPNQRFRNNHMPIGKINY